MKSFVKIWRGPFGVDFQGEIPLKDKKGKALKKGPWINLGKTDAKEQSAFILYQVELDIDWDKPDEVLVVTAKNLTDIQYVK